MYVNFSVNMESFVWRGDKALFTRQLQRLCQPYYHYTKFSSAATISSPINEQSCTHLLQNGEFTPQDQTLLKTIEKRLHIESVRAKSILDYC